LVLEVLDFSLPPLVFGVVVASAAAVCTGLGYWLGRHSQSNKAETSGLQAPEAEHDHLDTRMTEARLRTILDSEPECVKTVDCQQRLLYMNPAGLEMVAAKDMKSVHLAALSDLVIPEDLHIFKDSHETVFRGERSQVQFEIEALDGTRRYMDQISTPIFDPDDPGKVVEMLAVTRDITEQREATRQLVRARDDAEAANKAKSRFIATMSHELRTPLNGVLGMAQILSSTALNSEQRDMLGTLSKAGDNLLHVISDVLDYSRIEAGRIVIDQGEVDLTSVRKNLAAVHGVIARQNGIDLVFEGFEDVMPKRTGDEKRLLQILHNVVGNAVKFTDRGEVRVALQADPDGNSADWVSFVVTDTGIGIGQDQINAIFKPFTQLDDSSTRRHGGTGLGLAIARGLSEAMGGQISLAPRESGGTLASVTLSLPLQDTKRSEQVVEDTVLRPPSGETINGNRVLVVEDNSANQSTMTGMLQVMGVTATLAENGIEAVNLAKATRFDAIIMDIHMPIMNGKTALENIRQNEASEGKTAVPAIACTADVRPSHLIELHEGGFSSVIEKPIEMEYLRRILTQVLARGSDAGDADQNASQHVQTRA
jgi:PAS domain S-box-containing protein